MEATLLRPSFFHCGPFDVKRSSSRGSERKGILSNCPLCEGTRLSLKTTYLQPGSGCLLLNNRHFPSGAKQKFSVYCSISNKNEYLNDQAASLPALTLEAVPASSEAGEESPNFHNLSSSGIVQAKPKAFRNRFLNFVRLSSVLNNAAEYFFKSEMRRRLFVTAALLVISRVGYFIPLPGFDRRAMPQDYLSFVSGSADELGDLTTELKLSFFQLGISPQIVASILMQVLCHVVPSLVKLRKEGLDGHEKIKSYIWWISLGFAILEGFIVSCYSLPYSIYATTSRVKHVLVTTLLLVCGAMTMTWICDTISESGFDSNNEDAQINYCYFPRRIN